MTYLAIYGNDHKLKSNRSKEDFSKDSSDRQRKASATRIVGSLEAKPSVLSSYTFQEMVLELKFNVSLLLKNSSICAFLPKFWHTCSLALRIGRPLVTLIFGSDDFHQFVGQNIYSICNQRC